jgi:hypothetical protein
VNFLPLYNPEKINNISEAKTKTNAIKNNMDIRRK